MDIPDKTRYNRGNILLQGGRSVRKRWFLAVWIAALMCCAGARAQPDTPYDPDLLLWYPALTAEQQALFDLCYAAAAQGETVVQLPQGSGYDDVCAAMDALLKDCPELSWLSRYYGVRYYQQQPQTATQVTLRFNGQAGETAHVKAAQALADAAAGDGAWERALAIHDALCQAVSYEAGDRANDAYGALVQGRAVCDGYAGAYALICRLAGIRCGVITGTAVDEAGAASNHAWNLVDFGDAAMLVDVTWDDQEGLHRVEHSYFGLTDAWMSADHQEESALPRPPCQAEALNWHVRQGLALGAMEEAALQAWWESRLTLLRDGGASTVEARFLDEATFGLFLAKREEWLDGNNARMGAQGLYGSWSVLVTQAQRIFSMTLLAE